MNTVHERTKQFRDAAAKGPSLSGNAYKGLDAHAKPGLHAHLALLASEHFQKGDRLLDCAAGSGALTLRLRDLGFQMSATDYVSDNFRLTDVPFRTADLNREFSRELHGAQNGIIAAEIIEHLENPRHFLRECRKLLVPGGRLLLSTPNIDSPVSHTLLMRSGYPAWHSDADYRHHGHIMPIGPRLLRQCANECDFDVLTLTSFGDAFDHCHGSPRLRWLAKCISALDASPRELRGDILIAVLHAR